MRCATNEHNKKIYVYRALPKTFYSVRSHSTVACIYTRLIYFFIFDARKNSYAVIIVASLYLNVLCDRFACDECSFF